MFTATPVLPRPYKIENLLSFEQQTVSGKSLAVSAVSGWVNAVAASGGTAAGLELSRSTEEMKWTPASLRVLVKAAGTQIIVSDTDILVTPGETYRAFCWVRGIALQRGVVVGIEWHSGGTTTWTADCYTAQYVGGNAGWTLVSFIGEAPANTTHARFRIELPDEGAINNTTPNDYQIMWFDDLVFVKYDLPDNGFIRLLQSSIPEYMMLLDAEQEKPTYPMLRYLNLIAATANKMLNATIGFDFVPPHEEPENFNRCTLVETRFYPTDDIAETRWLKWLAFITATTVYSSTLLTTVATPWYKMTNYTWDYISTLTWSQVQDLSPNVTPTADLLRSAIQSKGTGILAGTREGLRRAVRLVQLGANSFDVPCSITVSSGVITAVIDAVITQTAILTGTGVCIYDSGISLIDNASAMLPVTSFAVEGGKTILKITAPAGVSNVDSLTAAYVTDRYVEVETSPTNIWDVTITTATAQNVEAAPSDLVLDIAKQAKAAGIILSHESI